MSVLVTGGAGYIGSHAAQRLLAQGQRVVILDNLSRGHREAVDLLQRGAGERLSFIEGDIGDGALVGDLLHDHNVSSVMHFAAYAQVGESVEHPLTYYENNTAGALTLIGACCRAGVERFVFSSTCATYGEPGGANIPIREDCPQEPINPYGRSKLMVEQILRDHARACADRGQAFAFCALRYFNVAGCDRSGVLGEDHDPETHLIPVVLQACLGQRDGVTIFGTDYPTPDGTCVRDYIHVEDLIDAHVTVMNALKPGNARAYNLGIGEGLSVKEIIDAVRDVTGKRIDVRTGERRPGDPPTLFADAGLIRRELGWRASITDVREIIGSAWRWFRDHPGGYAG